MQSTPPREPVAPKSGVPTFATGWMRPVGRLYVLVALLGVAFAAPAPIRAQSADEATICEAGRISNIFVDNRSIFQVDELPEGSPLKWLYRLANALHITTQESFILREVLFAEGDCMNPELLDESGRILRLYPFIATADVFPVRQSDGTYHVVIDTQDEWTTKFDLGIAVDQGIQLERVDLTEENLLGQGVLAQVFFRRRKEQRDGGFRLQQPRLFGTRTDAQIGFGKTRVGNFLEQELSYPFFSEVGRWAFRQEFRRLEQVFTYSTGSASDITHALLPFREEWAELSLATRLGQPGNLTLIGLGLTRERVEFRNFPGDLEVAIDDDFGATVPAPPEVQSLIAEQIDESVRTRLNFMVGQRNISFVRVRGLDALNGDQDVKLGTDIGLTVGRTLGIFGVNGLAAPDDVYGRLRFYAGAPMGASFAFVRAAGEGRRLTDGDGRWADMILEADAFSYVRPTSLPGHTIFMRASASGAWSMVTPFQLTLGGREGVRGFREEEAPGARRILFTVEDRIYLRWPSPDIFDFGLSVFADAGRMYAGDVPYGADTSWRGTVGFGLRLGFPARTRTVGRIDLAFPIGGSDTSGPIFRITMFELLGVATELRDVQLARSRGSRVGPDQFVTGR